MKIVKIIGSGYSMWEDLDKSPKNIDTIAVNCSGFALNFPLTHLFSWHWKQISAIKEFRLAEFPDCQAIVHSVKKIGRVDNAWDFEGRTSVSGLSAVDLAFKLGYDKVVLCGIPMEGGYFYRKKANLNFCDKARQNEVKSILDRYRDNVKSYSGFTKDIFGEPEIEWYMG